MSEEKKTQEFEIIVRVKVDITRDMEFSYDNPGDSPDDKQSIKKLSEHEFADLFQNELEGHLESWIGDSEILQNIEDSWNVDISFIDFYKDLFNVEFKVKKQLGNPMDIELMNYLQELADECKYSNKVIMRDSTQGRGWRLHTTTLPQAVNDVRQAIENYRKQKQQLT